MRLPTAAANAAIWYHGGMVDVCANETLDAIDLDNFEQFTIHADNLMDAVIELGKLLGVDWENI